MSVSKHDREQCMYSNWRHGNVTFLRGAILQRVIKGNSDIAEIKETLTSRQIKEYCITELTTDNRKDVHKATFSYVEHMMHSKTCWKNLHRIVNK